MKQKYSAGIVKILILAFLVITMFNSIFAQFQMEWGSQETINETWIQINLSTYFIDPIIVATPEYSSTTANFGIEVQITNITNTSFMIKSSDENFGSLDNITAHYIALERGSWELPGSGIKIEAGSITTNKIGSRSIGWDCPTEGEIINFANAFDSNPLVLATKASNNNPTTWSTTFKHGLASNGDSVGSSQMCIGHSFSKAISPGPFTNQEDLNWIAIDQGDGFLGGVEFEVLWQLQDSGDSGGNWINGYADPRPFTQSWNHAWIDAPNIILGGITSVAGTDGGWAVIHDTGNNAEIEIFVDEPNERAHAGSESGGGFAFTNGSFVEAPSSINWTTKSFDIGFGVITNGNISSSTTIETYKNHNNILVSCISGNCSNIISNFTTININHGNNYIIDFTCTNQTTGTFNAQYALESNEDTTQDILNVSCQIFKEFGDINVTLNSPTADIIRQVAQNQTIEIEVDITCSGDFNTTCGNVTAYPRYNGSILDLGDGSDGDVVINAANTIINDYTYLAGNELSGTTTITVNDASSFSLDDSVLIIQMQNGSGIGNAGQYEYATITAISGNDITLSNPLSNSYGSGTFNSALSSVTQIVRIPQYRSLTINSGGSITAPSWDGFNGGIVVFKSQGTTLLEGEINVSEKGFRGGTCGACGNNNWGTQGEGYLGIGGNSLTPNGNGGGGGYGPTGYGGEGGAGGGHATNGGNSISTFPATGGNSIGEINLSNTIFFGGGAGAGGDNDGVTPFPENIDGGGIVIIFSKQIINGTIEANGETGIYGGSPGGVTGSGAGGSILINSEIIENTSFIALGGPAVPGSSPDVGGAGGDGRIALNYAQYSPQISTPGTGLETTIASGQIIISDTLGDKPLWSLDPQYQTCMNMAEGDTCTLTWEINASGDINSSHLIDVYIESNVPVVNTDNSENFTIIITDNIIPEITLLNPNNLEKILTNKTTINLTFLIEDDDLNLNCTIYVNSLVNSTQSCNTNVNETYQLPISRGKYNWSISVIDSLNNTVNSSVFEFTIIKNSSKYISKNITWLSSNIYYTNITFIDRISSQENTKILTTIDNSLTGGSYNPLFDYSFSFSNFELLYWNTTNSNNIAYSTTSGNEYYIRREFRIGLE